MGVATNTVPASRHNVEAALAKADAVCASRGVRFTKLRRRVLELIWTNNGPSKAYDILGRLDCGNASSKPPTVYRTLDFLREHGLVHKLDSLSAYIGCEHPLRHNECYFLFCRHCENIEECCSDRLKSEIAATAKSHHFTPDRTTLEIQGTCRRCK